MARENTRFASILEDERSKENPFSTSNAMLKKSGKDRSRRAAEEPVSEPSFAERNIEDEVRPEPESALDAPGEDIAKHTDDPLEKILGKKRIKKRGVNRTIYISAELDERLLQLSEEHNIPVSKVTEKLLKSVLGLE